MGGKQRKQAEPTAGRGRLWFPGNPWPSGHGLAELECSLRIEPDETLWCDLHAVTRAYADEYPESLADESETESAWDSPSVWLNYHATSISSTKWRDDAGFQMATLDRPVRFAEMGQRVFEVDALSAVAEYDDDDFAFHIYCLGHDAVAAHKIAIAPRPDGLFEVTWTGLRANAYVGDTEFQHPFRLQGTLSPPLVLARRLTRDAASQMLQTLAPDAADFGIMLSE